MGTNHRINKLYTVIFGNVVGGSDHETDSPTTLPLRAKSSQQANTEDDRVKEVSASPHKDLAARNMVLVAPENWKHTPSYGTITGKFKHQQWALTSIN